MSGNENKSVMPWAVDYEFRQPVTKITETPPYEGLPTYERPRIRAGDPIRFSVNTIAEPTSLQGKRGYLISPGPGWANFELFCDEGTAMGGTDLAPSPLGYLTSAVAFCLLTHITGFLHREPMRISRIKVEMRGEFWTQRPGPDDGSQGAGGCDGFQCWVIIDSDEAPERIAGLIAVCRKACMAMQTIATAVPTATRVLLNGEELSISSPG